MRDSVLRRDRSVPHLGRKFYHCVMGLVCFSLYAFVLTREQALMMLGTIGGTFVALDVIRLWFPRINSFCIKRFGSLMRREELASISGNSFYVIGLICVALFFSKPIALLSVLFLAIGDPIAAVVGTMYGQRKLVGKKSLEGAAANYLFSALAAFALATIFYHLPFERAILIAVVGGAVSVVAELTPLPLDDNFTIPVMSACLLTVLSSVLPLF